MFRREYGDDSIRTFFISAAEKARSVRAHVAEFAGAQSDCRHRYIVRCLDDCDDIVLAERPEHFLHGRSRFFRIVLENVRPLRAVLYFADSLVREVCKHDISGHRCTSLDRARVIFPKAVSAANQSGVISIPAGARLQDIELAGISQRACWNFATSLGADPGGRPPRYTIAR